MQLGLPTHIVQHWLALHEYTVTLQAWCKLKVEHLDDAKRNHERALPDCAWSQVCGSRLSLVKFKKTDDVNVILHYKSTAHCPISMKWNEKRLCWHLVCCCIMGWERLAGRAASAVFSSVFSERELMFMFAICRRPSVCLSSVCNVRAPYSAD